MNKRNFNNNKKNSIEVTVANLDVPLNGVGIKRKASDCLDVRTKGYEEFSKRIDFGSPVPANQILLNFQQAKISHNANQNRSNSSVQFSTKHNRKNSDSSFPLEVLWKLESPMKVSVYKQMTFHIFHALNIIKQIKEKPDIQED